MKLLIIAIFLVHWNTVNSIDCYDCQNCEVPFNNQSSTTTCSNGVTQCIKVTASLGTVYNYVAKQCGPCTNATFIFGVTYMNVDCCTGNTCNGTTRLFNCSYILVLFFLYIFNAK